MGVQKVKLSNYTPHPDNPKKISKKELQKLKDSIQGFQKMMEIKPIIVDENNVILAGNQRYKALLELEYETVPKKWIKKVTNLSEEEKKQFIVRDNVENGTWVMSVFEESDFWKDTTFELWLGKDPVIAVPTITTEPVQTDIKSITLTLDSKTNPKFKGYEKKLRKILGTSTVTDTVYNAMKFLSENPDLLEK